MTRATDDRSQKAKEVEWVDSDAIPLAGWLVQLLVFACHGTPLPSGIWWPGLAALVAMSTAGFVVTIASLQQHDIGR